MSTVPDGDGARARSLVPEESERYEISYRAILKDTLTVFSDGGALQVDSEISFDMADKGTTAADCFAASLLGGIMHHIAGRAQAAGITLEDVEGKIAMTISEPLSVIGVIGCSVPPAISSVRITIYLWADIGERAIDLLERSLDSCFICNTMKKACDMDIRFVMQL